jgi:alkylation response protein AidB-like acyl-CoA dehydrogenase
MSEFALAPEIEALRDAAARLAARELAPNVRDAEAAGRWPQEVLAVLDGFPLGGLDLPSTLGGADAGSLAKVVVLEALAEGDAGGLPAADRPGRSAGAVLACPDRALVAGVAAACLAGEAQCAFTVVDEEGDWAPFLDWAPSWPALRWAWVCEGDELRLVEVTTDPEPTGALAFHASGGVGASLADQPVRGRWRLGRRAALDVVGRARLWAAAVAVGIAQAALDETIEYTLDRIVFNKPVAHHQGNAFDIAWAAGTVHGARLLVRDAARSFDRGEEWAGFWATQAWLETMATAFNVTNLGIQMLGGHGFIVDHLAEKRFREARMLGLLSGGRDAAEFDVAAHVLDVPDPLFAGQE